MIVLLPGCFKVHRRMGSAMWMGSGGREYGGRETDRRQSFPMAS